MKANIEDIRMEPNNKKASRMITYDEPIAIDPIRWRYKLLLALSVCTWWTGERCAINRDRWAYSCTATFDDAMRYCQYGHARAKQALVGIR